MNILRTKLENGIGRAEEYRWLGKNHPEGLNVHIEYIKDLIKPLVSSLGCQLSPDEESDNKLLADAKITLQNLQSEIAAVIEGVECPAIPKLRQKFLKLHSFDGSISEFRNFMTQFSNLIHSDLSITNAEKMIILKSFLKGEPLDFVDVFPTSATNYALALKLLEDVYGNSSCKLTKLYKRLNELPQVSMNDGARFRKTFWELESILQSMSRYGVDVNEDLCLRCLYFRKFSGKTLVALLIKDLDMSLPELRSRIRHLVNVEELQLESDDEADDTEDYLFSSEEPVVSQVSAERSTNAEGGEKMSYTAASINEPIATKDKKKLSTLKSSESCKLNFAKDAKSEQLSLSTVCTNVTCVASGKETSVRLLLQAYAPVSLISEDAARRLGISVPAVKTLQLRSTMGFDFTATQETFRLILRVGEERRVTHAHIVENGFDFSADDVPAADVDDFLREHPELSDLSLGLADTGKGRPIDLFLSGSYFWDCMAPEDGRIQLLPVKDKWRLQLTKFGWLLHGPVKINGTAVICSYWYPDAYVSL